MRIFHLGNVVIESGPKQGTWSFFALTAKNKPIKAAVRFRTPKETIFNGKHKDNFSWAQIEEIAKKRLASGKVKDWDMVVMIDGKEIIEPDENILKRWYVSRIVNAARKASGLLPAAKN